jgi:hypothetical protein
MNSQQHKLYRITFHNQGKVYELYATKTLPAELPGFIEISGITFNTRHSVVVDPSEEKLKSEFSDVSAFMVPFHSVIRIDEVTQQGTAKIHSIDGKGSVTPFSTPFSQPGRSSE